MQTQQAFQTNTHQASGYPASGYQASGYQASGYQASGYQAGGYPASGYQAGQTIPAGAGAAPLVEAYRRRLPALLTVLTLTVIALVTGATVLAGQAGDSAAVSRLAASGSSSAASSQR